MKSSTLVFFDFHLSWDGRSRVRKFLEFWVFWSIFELFKSIYEFIKVSKVFYFIFLNIFWVKQILKNKFLNTKYPNHDVSVTLWSPKSRPIDDAIFVFFKKKLKRDNMLFAR